MELQWEDPPVPDGPFFTRDLYDKYSLAPNIRELWTFLQSPVENIKEGSDVGAAKTSSSHPAEDAAEFKNKSWDSCDSDDPFADNAAEGAEECKGAKKSKVKVSQVENEARAAFPEPRLPYPRVSTLSSKDQSTYLGYLMSKKTMDPPQSLKAQVNKEVMQFMRYLQDVARVCVDDYNFISQGAMQYSEDFFRSCLDYVRMIPQLYQIHEMTSLTGGTFNPGLKLTFEKQLLIMGNVDITDHKIVPADAQLASDYHSVSSETPPAKKAKDMHATISSDGNAEKLSARYEPHVCMTRDALVKLLDNHGPDFGEPWELPVWIKSNPGKGSSLKKTVYIDSPLLKTEMTVRERSRFYHEESLKLSITNNGRKNLFHLMTELPVSEQQPTPECSQRNLVSFENESLDFEVDLTDLETFGDTAPVKVSGMQKVQTEQHVGVKYKSIKATSVPPVSKKKTSSGDPANKSSSSLEDMNTSSAVVDDPVTKEAAQQVQSETCEPKTEQLRHDSAQESDRDVASTGESDDEKLVIDDLSPAATPTTQPKLKSSPCSPDPPVTPASETLPVKSPQSSSPEKVTRQTRLSKRSKSGDQLGEILRMQTAMFTTAGKCSTTVPQETTPCMAPPIHSNPTSLVKPCVSSYLERNQNQDGETCSVPHKSAPVVNVNTTEHRKILSHDLQAGAEDEQDYQAPEEGNLLYKLYSLQDMLLLVRSSVSLTHSRLVGSKNQYVPVHVLPKLEYQLSYGVECLTRSEACQLWTETLLHSSTVSFIAHINTRSSEVALLRKLPDDWKQNISCGFTPSKSLNILHHLLKKVTGLDEGQYLIAHKAGEPFVTLLKAATGKVSRGAYNLQQLHGSVPQPPASGFVPWVPVDPAVVLPFHQAHGRVPCTFPAKPLAKTARDGSSQANGRGAGQSKSQKRNAGGNVKNKRSKRTARRNNYIQKLIQKSV
ncbi:little elongation complex subunit 2 [Hippoglossus stenolepis]|uniref:little elongation complex subunit 2 n=1 Tax=Hippoglossus stenolepis TaxID=195615 RepID=UPI00159C9C44|nr:little elongation complex subunit 2 [Hippoglossus stenolepis]